MAKNIFYFKYICEIGGTEQFLYEIAKKYFGYDIEVMYEVGAKKQIERLSKYVKCTEWHPPKMVECEKYFANFNLDQANYVKAKEYYFVIHANFNELGYKPNIKTIEHLNPKFIAVSKWARDKFIEFTGKDCDYCYNPLMIEPKEKVLHLVSACRLNDSVKGGARTLQLIKALDRYAELNGRHYLWHIFTNDTHFNISSPNVVLMKRRVDVRPFIQDADYVLQLSNDMETYCYTLNEAWSYGVHTISTPLSVLNELPIPAGANKILEYDCSNADEVAKYIFENKLNKFDYEPPLDRWFSLLAEGDSQYQKELKMKVKARMTLKSDGLNDKYTGQVFHTGDEVVFDKVRFEELSRNGYCELVENIEEVERAVPKQKKVTKRAK